MSNEPPSSSACFSIEGLNDCNDDSSELTGSCNSDDLSLQEQLDILSSKLSQCQNEKEVLQAEKAVLVDELALAIQEQPDTRSRWLNKGAGGIFKDLAYDLEGVRRNGGSMQMLLDANAKLMMENARLQVVVNVIRKSFQSYIKDGRGSSEEDNQTIETLHGENELLRQSQNDGSAIICLKKLSSSGRTARTYSLESSFTDDTIQDQDDPALIDSSEHSIQYSVRKNSLHSIPETEKESHKFDTSGDDWTIDGENIDASHTSAIESASRRFSVSIMMGVENEIKDQQANKKLIRSQSDNLLVGQLTTQLSQSLNDGTPPLRRKTEELLVDFGERESRSPKTMVRRWSSLTLKL